MAESKEYSTIIKCRRKLEIALESDRDIAQFLLQQGFITQERYDEVINPKSNLTDADKASMLVTAIRNRVELNPRNYHKVVNHLRQNIIRYGDIVEILDQQYHQTTAVGSPLQPVTNLSVMVTPSGSPLPVPNVSPLTIPYEGMTSMMATLTLHPVPNAAFSKMRSPNESSEGGTSMLVTPSLPPAVPNASPSPRFLYKGSTYRIATPPPNNPDGATVSNDNSVMATPSPLPLYEGSTSRIATPPPSSGSFSASTMIEQEIENLEEKFNEIADMTFDEIKTKNPDVVRFIARLVSLPIKYRELHKEFFTQLMEFVEKDTTIERIWMKLSEYWDFLNYTLLENLVHKFCDHTLKANMEEYVKRLKRFRTKTLLCEFTQYCNKINKELPEHDLREVVVKLKKRWDECTLEDLEELKENITQQFFLPSFVMRLKSIKPGSIVVTWTIPMFIASALRQNIQNMDISEFCKENEIERILIDGKEFSKGTTSMLTTPITAPHSGSFIVPSKRSSTDPSERIQPGGKDASDKFTPLLLNFFELHTY